MVKVTNFKNFRNYNYSHYNYGFRNANYCHYNYGFRNSNHCLFLYPSILNSSINFDLNGLTFLDQFAIRPSGSTTAAIISNLHIISTLLVTNPFVHVIGLDFSKAFDSVRHSTLLQTNVSSQYA